MCNKKAKEQGAEYLAPLLFQAIDRLCKIYRICQTVAWVLTVSDSQIHQIAFRSTLEFTGYVYYNIKQ